MAQPQRVPDTRMDSGKATSDSPESRRSKFSVVGGKSPTQSETKTEESKKAEQKNSSSNTRITSADRSKFNRPFFNNASGAQPGRVTIDKKFSDSYKQAGLQPFVSTDGRIRKGQIEYKSRFAKQQAANDEVYAQSVANNVVQFPQRDRADEQQSQMRASAEVVQFPQQQRTKPELTRIKTPKGQRRVARRKAMAINRIAMSPLWFTYIFFQLPLAIISIIMLGFVYIQLAALDAARAAEDDFFWGALFGAVEIIADAVSGFVEFVTFGNIDLGAIFDSILNMPTNFLIASMVIVFAYGIILLLILGLTYQGAGIKSLSGRSSGAKMMAFLGCLFGYFWPIFNLFPWIFIWTFVVGKNPT